MNVISKSMAVCGALFLGAVAAHAQYFKIYQKSGHAVSFHIGEVDSVTTGERYGDFYHRVFLRGSEGETKDYYLYDVDSLRFVDLHNIHSILDELQKRGNYTCFLRLVDDCDAMKTGADFGHTLRGALAGVGDYNVFVADDSRWEEFFRQNASRPEGDPWRSATSYDALSPTQKRQLVGACMVDPLPLRALAGPSTMRRAMHIGPADMVTFMSDEDMPSIYSKNDKDYWAHFRSANGGRGIYLLTDHSQPMLMFFSDEYRKAHDITDADYVLITGQQPDGKVRVGDTEVTAAETPTDNGFVNPVAAPIVPWASMADVIRTNGRTHIFSHILDRYCAPFYNDEATQALRKADPSFADSVFTKRYFSDNSYGHRPLTDEPEIYKHLAPYMPYLDANSGGIIPSLKFDPAWHGFYDEMPAEQDMAAMFVPSDKAMWQYFTEGAGRALIQTYVGADYAEPTTRDELYRLIDQIPLGTMQVLVNIIMMRSFAGSVPSKMTRLRDDAQEQLFQPEDVGRIDTCLLASNGAVYVMDAVYGPADYTSVTSPAYVTTTSNIIKWAIYNGTVGTDYMGTHFYTYLKSPADMTFFLPTDEAMQYYYDPTSFRSTTKRVIRFGYQNQAFPIKTMCLNYDPETGIIGRAITGQGSSMQQLEVANRLKDILYSHTIVNDERQNIHSRNEYYETLGGTIVRVLRDEAGRITGVQGGFQMENQRQGISGETPGVDVCHVASAYESLKNGQTYTLDAPIVPTPRSVFSILSGIAGWGYWDEEKAWSSASPYARFFELCQVDEEAIIACGLVDAYLSQSKREAAMQRYQVFASRNGLDYNLQFANSETLTLYVPTNEAVEKAIQQGLPTWEQIRQESQHIATFADSLRIQEKIERLTAFVRGHFHYGAALADREPFERRYTVPYIDRELGTAPKLTVRGLGEGELAVTDAVGTTCRVTGPRNVIARDIICSSTPIGVPMSTSSNRITLDAATTVVIHQIDGVLNFKP